MNKLEKIIQENSVKILALEEAGVFDMQSGKVEINIHNSQIQSIHTYQMTYKLSIK